MITMLASTFLAVEDTEWTQYFGISCMRGTRVLGELSIGNPLQGFDEMRN